MRNLLATIISMSILTLAVAQEDDVFSNKTNLALTKVIRDFPNRFHNIMGELLATTAKITQYKSTVQIPGFSSCLVIRNASSGIDAFSWDCTAFQSRDFSLAKAKYKEIYNEIQNTIIKIDGEKPFIVSGQYMTPFEERKYCSVAFELLPSVGEMKKLKLNLIIQSLPSQEWKVSIDVYDSAKKEDEVAAASN